MLFRLKVCNRKKNLNWHLHFQNKYNNLTFWRSRCIFRFLNHSDSIFSSTSADLVQIWNIYIYILSYVPHKIMAQYQIWFNLITKTRLSLTDWLRCPMLHKAKHSQLRKKGLALNNLQSCLRGRVDKALDLTTDGGFAGRFDSRHEQLFFLNDDGRATRSGSGKRKRQRTGMSSVNVGACSLYSNKKTQMKNCKKDYLCYILLNSAFHSNCLIYEWRM